MDTGYIYIIYNKMYEHYGNNVFKVGKTKDIAKRLNSYTTSYIEPVEIKFLSSKVKHYTLTENNIFKLFKLNRIAKNREFFRFDNIAITIELIENEVNRINNMEIEDIELENNKRKSIKIKYIVDKELKTETIKKELEKILTKDELLEYKFLMDDVIKYDSFCSFIKMFKRVDALDENSNKIKLLRKFEQENNIIAFDINFSKSENIKINTSNEQFKIIKKVFRSDKAMPKDINELKILYVGLLKHIFGNFDIVKSVKKTNTKNKNIKLTIYIFNDELINKLFKLIFSKFNENLDTNLIQLIGVKVPNNI